MGRAKPTLTHPRMLAAEPGWHVSLPARARRRSPQRDAPPAGALPAAPGRQLGGAATAGACRLGITGEHLPLERRVRRAAAGGERWLGVEPAGGACRPWCRMCCQGDSGLQPAAPRLRDACPPAMVGRVGRVLGRGRPLPGRADGEGAHGGAARRCPRGAGGNQRAPSSLQGSPSALGPGLSLRHPRWPAWHAGRG